MRAVKSSNPTRESNQQKPRLGKVIPKPRVPPSPPTTFELRGVPVHFPFQPYDCQKDYMGKVIDSLLRSENALLESPTGTGKTLCLLCATLAWQRQEARKRQQEFSLDDTSKEPTSLAAQDGKPRTKPLPTIIYASRTHSQLSQVVRELRNTRYRPKHAVLGSREQMCVNPKVKKNGSTGSDINHDCTKLCKDRKCRFRNKLEGFQAPGNESGGGGTSFYGTQPVRDMEDLLDMGNTHKVCPFYYTRSLVEEAELILVPYNYLFDKDSRSTTLADVPWDNAVVIFDEAHNLESFASESASFDLSTTDIGGCLREVDRAVNYVQTFSSDGGSGSLKIENIAKVKSIFLKLEEYILTSLNQQTSAYRGEFMMEIFQNGASINHSNHELFIAEVRKLSDVFLEFGGGNSRGAPKLDHFVQCVKRVFGEPSEARCLAKAQSYRVHVSPKQNTESGNGSTAGRTVSYWCFAPSEAMRELAGLDVRSILVTSGTLSPLESYALELDLPFPNRLENPHIVADDQIHVRVLGKGVSGKLLTSSYQRRQDDEYYTELGNTLVSLGKVIPGGMLVFFPSYGVMETCLERWGGPANSRSSFQDGKKPTSTFFAARKRKPTGSARYSFPHAPHTFSASKEVMNPWKRLLGVKAVVLEPRSTTDLPDAIAEFHKYLQLPKSRGVALFGVCRGKISEGIDFAHDMCRAVVITGLPFAPSFDPKVKMKREFLDQNRAKQNVNASTNGGFGATDNSRKASLSGHEWYTQTAHRAVNQAVGRVIRNKNDYGAVLLMDSRFGLPPNQKGLSKWVRPHVQPDEGVGRTISGLVKFYRNAEKKALEQAEEPPPPPVQNPVSVILKYEEEDSKENQVTGNSDEDLTKVAFIGSSKGDAEQMTAPVVPNPSYIPPERIIATVDMQSSEGLQQTSKVVPSKIVTENETVAEKQPGSDTPSSLGTQSSQVSSQESASTARVTQKHSVANTGTSTTKNATVKPSHTAAKEFFQGVQQHMSPAEQSQIRKAAVAMKGLTDRQHRRQFLDAAIRIVKILLSYDTFENKSCDDKPKLLVLLLQLLPNHFVQDVQRATLAIIFDNSKFRKAMAGTVDDKNYQDCRRGAVGLLKHVWFNTSDSRLSPAPFLQRLEKVLTPLNRTNDPKKPLRSFLGLFSQLVPIEFKGHTTAFVDQLIASTSISKLRAKEKAAPVEFANSRPARAPPIKPETSERKEVKPSQGVDPTSKANTTPSNKEAASSERTNKRQNPYSKPVTGLVPDKAISTASKPDSRPAKARKGVLGSLLGNAGDQNKGRPGPGSVHEAVRLSESETFTGKRATDVSNTIQSNAPESLTCALCERHASKPYISDCGHMACLQCWKRWLAKSKTCPHCRKPASEKSLALAVFQAGEAVP